MCEIIPYEKKYEDDVMRLIEAEGEAWKIYWGMPNALRYRESLGKSITYLALCDQKVCGYSRSLNDALCIYVCDLLVNQEYRGREIGRKLMECVKDAFPETEVYIMSGNDAYYSTLGYQKEGSIYLLGNKEPSTGESSCSI